MTQEEARSEPEVVFADGKSSSEVEVVKIIGRVAAGWVAAQAGEEGHGFLTGRAVGRSCRWSLGSWTEEDAGAREEGDAGAIADGGRVQKTIIADGAKSAGEDVTQIAFDELGARNGHGLVTVVGAVFPEKGDGIVGAGDHALIADDAAGDISAKISDGMSPGSGRLNTRPAAAGPSSDWESRRCGREATGAQRSSEGPMACARRRGRPTSSGRSTERENAVGKRLGATEDG